MLEKSFSCVCLLVTLFSGTARAEAHYFGMDAMFATYKSNSSFGSIPELHPKVLGFKFGRQLSPHVAVEGRLGLGLGNATETRCFFDCLDITLEFEHYFGAYIKFMPAERGTRIYGLLGFTKTKVNLSDNGADFCLVGSTPCSIIPGGSISETETDLSYGLGLEIQVSEGAGLNVEYLQAVDNGIQEFSSINIGFVSYF